MDQPDTYGILIHAFRKNRRTSIRIHVQEYMETVYLDVREFFYDASNDA